jgi:hypothetical protein
LDIKRAIQERSELMGGKEIYLAASVSVAREILPQIVKQGKASDRDAVLLYFYLLSYVQTNEKSERHMMAWPSLDKINQDTGIRRDRIPKLIRILESVGLLETQVVKGNKKREKLYLPHYLTK